MERYKERGRENQKEINERHQEMLKARTALYDRKLSLEQRRERTSNVQKKKERERKRRKIDHENIPIEL